MEQLLDDVPADNGSGRGNEGRGNGINSAGGSSEDDDGYQIPDVEYHDFDFDEETLHQMVLNDRRIEGLYVAWVDADDTDITDWERRLGSAIGGHSHLKALKISHFDPWSSSEGFQDFCQGLVHNRSIEHLILVLCNLKNVDMFEILTPFFEHNSTLRAIDVSDCVDDVTISTVMRPRSLSLALSKRDKCSLRRIKLDGNQMGDDAAADLIEALNQHGNLEYLSLESNKIGLKSCVALAKLLKESSLKLQELDLSYNKEINDECITILTNALAANRTIKRLCFDGLGHGEGCSNVTSTGWCAFSTILYHPMCSLEKLHLNLNAIDDEGATALGNALAFNKTLKYLNLGSNRSTTGKGWREFSLCLGNPRSALEELCLSSCNIDDEGATAIARALADNTTLKSLNMSSISSITPRGWSAFFSLLLNSELSLETLQISNNSIDDEGLAIVVEVLAGNASLNILNLAGYHWISNAGMQMFANLLRRPECALKELSLGSGRNVNDDVVIDFANSLTNNTSLETLSFACPQGQVTGRGWEALSTVLCNKSSIDNTYSSNHTLKEMYWAPGPVRIYLEMNKSANKAEVARLKILGQHFSDGDANIHVFTDMEMKTMPRAISWIGRDHIGFSLLYHLVRSMPALVESETKQLVRGKRKYICSEK